MPFTLISRISLLLEDRIDQQDVFYFYPLDIALVRNQPGVNALRPSKAVFNGVETTVLVGITVSIDANGAHQVVDTFDQPEHKVALACPPFNDDELGGTEKFQE